MHGCSCVCTHTHMNTHTQTHTHTCASPEHFSWGVGQESSVHTCRPAQWLTGPQHSSFRWPWLTLTTNQPFPFGNIITTAMHYSPSLLSTTSWGQILMGFARPHRCVRASGFESLSNSVYPFLPRGSAEGPASPLGHPVTILNRLQSPQPWPSDDPTTITPRHSPRPPLT